MNARCIDPFWVFLNDQFFISSSFMKFLNHYTIALFLLTFWLFKEYTTAWRVPVFGVFLIRIFPHSDWIRENTDQINSKYGHFSRSVQHRSVQTSSPFLISRTRISLLSKIQNQERLTELTDLYNAELLGALSDI